MEDGDGDTSLTSDPKQNGNSPSDGNNIATDKVEWKVSFAVEEDLILPNSSKEVFSHLSDVESTEFDVKEDDISGQSCESKTSDLADAKTPEFLEDNCDKTKKIVEGENVSEQSDEIVCRREHSEYFSVQSEVLYSKDRESLSTSDESEDNLHTSTEEEVKTSSPNKKDVLYDKHVTTTSDDLNQPQKQNESNENCDSEDEYHKKSLNTSDSVNVTESDLGCEMNTSDSFSNSDSQNDKEEDETSSQKDKDTSETFDSSANVNDSYQNDSSSVSSSLSQSSAKNSLSQQEKEDSFCEETSEMEVTCESELVNIEERRNFEGSLSVNAMDKQVNFEESPLINQKCNLNLGVEEMEVSDSVNEDDENVSQVNVQMKQDDTIEPMEVDSSEWREHKTGQESDSEFPDNIKPLSEDQHKEVNEVVNEPCMNEGRRMSDEEMCEEEGEQSEVMEKEMSDDEVEKETSADNEKEMSGDNEYELSDDNGKDTSKDMEKKMSENREKEISEYNEIEMHEYNETEVSENNEKETSEYNKKEMCVDNKKKTNKYNEDDTSENTEKEMSECSEKEMSECSEKEMSECSEREMSECSEKEVSEYSEKEISEDNEKEISGDNEKKRCDEIEQEMCEVSEQEMYEEAEKEMSVDDEKDVNKILLDQEECSPCQRSDDSQTQVRNNPEKSQITNYLGNASESVYNFLDRQQESTLMEYTSSFQESENKISDDEGSPVKQSIICNKAVNDGSVKVNGEVDATQRNFEECESNSPVKEKVILKRKLQTSPTQEQSADSAENESCKINVCFKGFKKRYIAQVSEATAKQYEEPPSVNDDTKLKNKRSIKKFVMEPTQVIVSHQQLADREQTDTPLTEYAQYLGLQPTVKFKCYNCGESGFPSMIKLQEHQNICLKNANTQNLNKPAPLPFVEPVPSTNFRITRKVYLCSACGTYYENWNLFLHMREVHKRHVCLFCLLMFSQADKLAGHLTTKHGITDDEYSSPEEFLNEYDSSFFVMCCSCEQMFTERDNFFDHLCGNLIESNGDQACSLCGLRGAHFPTCRRAFTDSSAVTSPSQSSHNSNVGNSEPPPSSQCTIQEKVPKYAGSAEKSSSRKSHPKQTDKANSSDKNRNRPECEDDYDISDAASYCHVNIDEPDKQKVPHSNDKDDIDQEIAGEPAIKSKKLCHENDFNKLNPEVCAETSKNIEEETRRNDSGEESVSYTSQPEASVEKDSFETSENCEHVSNNTSLSDDTKLLSGMPPEPKESPESVNTQTTNINLETTSLTPLKSHKEHDSESDTSASAGDTRGSDDSSSGSEASSDENETGNNRPAESGKVVASDESDGDKSDSDKMSIVVDEVKSDEDADKQENGNGCNANSIGNRIDAFDAENSKNMDPDVKLSEDKLLASNTDSGEEQQDNIQIAGDDVPLLELTLEENMDTLPIQALVKECVKISCSTCVYCNHAKKIAVNGKQLVLHLLAEHRFEPVVCSDSGELIPVHGFIENLKGKLTELQEMYFNTDSYDSANKSLTKPYDRTYECFHCHFITTLHKELYVHNRKMHQKTILLCIMCKSNFYSYSELLCHLCPGIYVPDSNISFRCCLCAVDGLPSAFRLMVHLRKRHHACDVCLETTGDQQKLSNHVWKHKLHHLCYRCGIAYRNKPDITKHLFWKHGTESVLCKKCLQKKWPHVYHFCIPPTAFLCEECNASFSRAVALKVHKRLHVGDIAYECDECQEKFISKKLLRRHKDKHKQEIDDENKIVLQVNENKACEISADNINVENDGTNTNQIVDPKEEEMECSIESASNLGNGSKRSSDEFQSQQIDSEANKKSDETSNKKSKVVDVYDLPPLNLSESDDSEDDSPNKKVAKDVESEDSKIVSSHHSIELPLTKIPQEGESQIEEETQPVEIVDGVWDNFKNYKANLEKREILQAQVGGTLKTTESSTSFCSSDIDCHTMMDIILADHDYCIIPEKPKEEISPLVANTDHIKASQKASSSGLEVEGNADDKESFGADHNYCFNTSPTEEERKESSEAVTQNPSSVCPQTPPLQISNQTNAIPLSTPNSSPKKKQKSPKKKQKQSGSSSSSDSSSNSDSSSCTCGTNCSCSSTSSSSSGSSSSSSDSDSSSSEGRRRQAARRERRRERSKRKLDMESRGGTPPATASSIAAAAMQSNNLLLGTPMQIDTSGPGMLQVDDIPPAVAPEPEESEFLIRESDLDTTETETDEDFYDKYPQRQANKLLAEKRNQLLLLAAVAPVNNGTLTKPSSPPAAQTVVQPEQVQKKKGKTKRHKKAQHNVSEKKVENKLKLNIPASYFNNPSFSVTNPNLVVSPVVNSQNLSSSHASRVCRDTFSPAPETSSTPSAYHSTGSGSENESKRLSKRKRIPKRFYGDSSDEEGEQIPHQPYKWRKITPNNNTNPPPPPSPNVSGLFTFRNISVNVPPLEPVQPVIPQVKSDDDDGDDSESDQEAKRSSSDSSNSDSDNEHSDGDSDIETATNVTNMLPSASGNVNQQKNENLYCYCQCPYDEVSEMIACDGKDCSIEWFHFECVGIMVPPKGKWFCPDCRKKTAGRSEYLLHA